jgi:hypothetical protein
VSYYFIAIVWLNRHHLFRFFPHVTARLIWINSYTCLWCRWFGSRRRGSLTRNWQRFPCSFMRGYLCSSTWRTSRASGKYWVSDLTKRSQHVRDDSQKTRSSFTLGTFVIAVPVSPKYPWLGFGLICCALLVYLRPEILGAADEVANRVAASER